MFVHEQKQGSVRGWSHHLAGGVVTYLGEASVPHVTSQGVVIRTVKFKK